MKKETIKELGKHTLDISKIVLALAIITPLVKDENISFAVIVVFGVLILIGTYLTNKGVKDE